MEIKNIFLYESSNKCWCETNYQINIYICEFMNTIT